MRRVCPAIIFMFSVLASQPVFGQERWVEIHRPGESRAEYRRIPWDSVAAVVLDASESGGAIRRADIYVVEGNRLRMYGSVSGGSSTYAGLRTLLMAQRPRWTPAIVTQNGSPYRYVDAFVDIELAQRIAIRRVRDIASREHDAYVVDYGSAASGAGQLNTGFAIIDDANRDKIRDQLARSLQP
jgi:hypothetical protein